MTERLKEQPSFQFFTPSLAFDWKCFRLTETIRLLFVQYRFGLYLDLDTSRQHIIIFSITKRQPYAILKLYNFYDHAQTLPSIGWYLTVP